MQIKSYEGAVKYLEGFIGKVRFEITPEFVRHHDPLERVRVLLSLLDNPQDKFRSVLVGGTSGKGSTAYLISHILTTAGYKTGFTLSPHLQKVNERLQINGKPISDKKFVEVLHLVIPAIEKMKKMKIRLAEPGLAPQGAPSYFEILIGMAFTYFAQQKVDIAIAEVGMGGEFDATNTLNPLVAILTNVGLDHTNILGKSVSQIARTKAGIIKKNLIVVSGVKQPSVIKIVEDKCKEVGAEVFRLIRDFSYKIKKEGLEGSVFDLISPHGREVKLNNLQLSLLGSYQVENASLAIETVLQLKKFGFEVSENAIRKALSTAFFPGRFEILQCHPEFISGSPARRQASLRSNEMLKLIRQAQSLSDNRRQVQDDKGTTIVLDGAHNPTKMKEFLKSLKKIFPKEKKLFIVGFKFDKDIPRMLRQIIKVADEIIVTQFQAKTDVDIHASAKALNLKSLILSLKSDAKVTVEKDSKKALKVGIKTIQQYNNTAILVATGSLYLVGEIRNML